MNFAKLTRIFFNEVAFNRAALNRIIHSRGKQLYWKETYQFCIYLFEATRRKTGIFQQVRCAMCIDKKKLRFILSDYSVIKEANQA